MKESTKFTPEAPNRRRPIFFHFLFICRVLGLNPLHNAMRRHRIAFLKKQKKKRVYIVKGKRNFPSLFSSINFNPRESQRVQSTLANPFSDETTKSSYDTVYKRTAVDHGWPLIFFFIILKVIVKKTQVKSRIMSSLLRLTGIASSE